MDPYKYIIYYNYALLFIMLFAFVAYSASSGEKRMVTDGINKFGIWILPILAILFIGTRPLSGAFVDMPIYAYTYETTAFKDNISTKTDFVYDFIVKLMSGNFSTETFFILCAGIYVAPLAIAVSRIHRDWGFAAFLTFISAFSFFNYGVNGIRNGMAASVAIMAISYYDFYAIFYLLAFISVGLHKSLFITIGSFMVTKLTHRPWIYLAIWLTSIGLSVIYGERSAEFLTFLMPADELARFQEYFAIAGQDKGGFRVDFILYSIVPVVISYLFATKEATRGIFYQRLLCAYLLSNSFWIMAMYGACSNRFAYLSWCILPWVIVVPHIPTRGNDSVKNFTPTSPILVGIVLLAHFAFTFTMHMFIYR